MKLLKGLGVAAVLLLGAGHAGAEEITLQTKSVLNHKNISYVPTKLVTNQLKAPVTWNNQNKTLTIKKDQTAISIKLGESTAKVNGKVVNTSPIVVKEGISYLPLRFIGETLNMNVQWTPEVITLTTYDQYIVKAGDYLYRISQKFGVSVEEIQKINNMKDDKIQVGQVLYLKPSVVVANETTAKEESSIVYDDMVYEDKLDPTPEKPVANMEKETDKNEEKEIEEQKNVTKIVNKGTSTFEYTPYVVVKGDYLSKISSDYKVSLKDLLAANNLTETTVLQIGDRLVLPKRVIPTQSKASNQHGEYLDWWTEAQYVFPIGEIATVTDFETGVSFQIRRSYGANHADCEPLTAEDTAKAKEVWGGFTWDTRAVLIHVGDRTVAASMSFMPHDIQSILDNDFEGHFDIHFKDSTRHKDGKIDHYHQDQIRVAAGVESHTYAKK